MSATISAVEALQLTHQLDNALRHDIYFAQVLVNRASETEIKALRQLIGLTNNLLGTRMTTEMRRQHINLQHTDRSLLRRTKKSIRTVIKTGRVLQVKKGTEQQ